MRGLHLFSVLLTLPLLLVLFSGCSVKDSEEGGSHPAEIETDIAGNTTEDRIAKDPAIMERAMRIAAALDDRQLAAQLIISGIDGRGQLTRDMKILLSECPAGGIMLFRYNLDTDNDAIISLIAESSELVAEGNVIKGNAETTISIYPFIGTDHEGGTVNRFRPGVADLPHAASYREMAHNENRENAIAQITTDSFNAGKAIGNLGLNLNFAPVAEYLNAYNQDFLEDRSYSPDSGFTAEAAAAFIMGMEQAGILCVIKHFPGSAGADPHYFSSVLQGDRVELRELASPFAALIQDGHARAIMVSHSAVPAWDRENIASLSPQVMGVWLRQELGFAGIIICDDFSMAAAITVSSGSSQDNLRPETQAVRSLAAGADMVLVWPPDLRRTHRAILAALDEGRLSRERLQESAERILFEKLRMGLVKSEQETGIGE